MKSIKTLTLVGGISRNSLNKKYFRSIQELSVPNFEFETFDITKLPFFSQDLEMDPPDIVTEYKEKIREAEAVLFITPEYNRSFPGVLKNAIDWGSRPYGQNLWNHKAAALLGASPGAIGTFGAQHHLRQVLAYLNMRVLGQPEVYFNASHAFDDQDRLTDEKTKDIILHFFEAFNEWIHLVTEKNNPEREDIYQSRGLEDSPLAH